MGIVQIIADCCACLLITLKGMELEMSVWDAALLVGQKSEKGLVLGRFQGCAVIASLLVIGSNRVLMGSKGSHSLVVEIIGNMCLLIQCGFGSRVQKCRASKMVALRLESQSVEPQSMDPQRFVLSACVCLPSC